MISIAIGAGISFDSLLAMQPRELLNETLAVLLAQNSTPPEMRAALDRLGDWLAARTGITGPGPEAPPGAHTWTDFGMAISPVRAAACLREYTRTIRFIQGVHRGLERIRSRGSSRPIDVLYAGCGPYALLLTPFAAHYPPGEVRVSLVDIHDESLDAVRKIAGALGPEAGEFFHDFIRADATRYRPPAGRRYDMLVTETMNRALTKEPQPAIVAHLAPLLEDDGILIPEEVRVDAALVPIDASEKGDSATRELGRVLTLNARTASDFLRDLAKFQVDLPDPAAFPEGARVELGTTIRVLDEIELGPGDGSLNLALHLGEWDPNEGVDQLEIRYIQGAQPRFESNLPVQARKRIHGREPVPGRLRSYRLESRFDPNRLRTDLERVAPDEWFAHYNKRDYAGTGWDVAALRSLDGRKDMIYSVSPPLALPLKSTELLGRCDYFREVLESFACELLAVRLLRVAPGTRIESHNDPNLSIEAGEARLHIPILTDPAVEFILGGERLEMLPGECWYANFDQYHSIDHRGTHPRVHLIVDALANDWLRERVPGS